MESLPRGIANGPARCSVARGRQIDVSYRAVRSPEAGLVGGSWDAPDTSCLLQPKRRSTGVDAGTLSSSAALEGFADIHVHQMAHLGFGGSLIWGGAFGDPERVLGPIPGPMKTGHDTMEVAVDGHTVETILNYLMGDVFTHGEDGYPGFVSWPAHADRQTHQQVYEDWLFREYVGGLRLMVMLANNSEDPFGRGENRIPIIGHARFQKVKADGRSGNDMEAVEWQIREAYEMQAAVDRKHGGEGKGWYRIVTNPDEASDVLRQGKLAVILGVEVQHLFNCDDDRPRCDRRVIVEGLDRLEGMGVSYVFPVHHKHNQFAGAAEFVPLNSGPTQPCVEFSKPCSSEGLSASGTFFIGELMARGMMIDTEHMSRRAFEDAMDITNAAHYPVFAGHVVPLDLQGEEGGQTERARSRKQLLRILDDGGAVAVVLSTSAEEYAFAPNDGAVAVPRVPIVCANKEGSGADQWANAYLMVRDLANESAHRPGSQPSVLAVGSDFNGIAQWPGPRRNPGDPCVPRRADGYADMEPAVSYPFELPPTLVPVPTEILQRQGTEIPDATRLDIFRWSPDRARCGTTEICKNSQVVWDYNTVGVANAGLVPDFLENVRLLGLTQADLEPIYRSARGIVETWRRARSHTVSAARRNLRWVAATPFDVLDFKSAYRDRQVEILAREGFPVCRTTPDRRLGFEQDGACRVVETSPAGDVTSQRGTSIVAYHAGRCLDAGSSGVSQRTCIDASSQQWKIVQADTGSIRVVSSADGSCLAVVDAKRPNRVAVDRCTEALEQRWHARPMGNTFLLQAVAVDGDHCLQVPDQSRDDAVPVELLPCDRSNGDRTGYASNQLWSIDSMRAGDYQVMQQSGRNRVRWQNEPESGFVKPVPVDGDRLICRSADSSQWLGTVQNSECIGMAYDGSPQRTNSFDRLFEAADL